MAAPLTAFLSLVVGGRAWGPDGHTIVAHVADQFLTNEANATLFKILGDTSLTNAADWCDDFDHTPAGEWSAPLHYINYPGHTCAFDWSRDCAKDRCNVGAIANYTRQIFDNSISADTRVMAVKFVIHMMGDVHQPLHVASSDDRGGNDIIVSEHHFDADPKHWDNHSANLHSLWDTAIVVQAIDDLKFNKTTVRTAHKTHEHEWWRLADDLLKSLSTEWSNDVQKWQATIGHPNADQSYRAGLSAVASETAALGCKYAYAKPDGTRVQKDDVLDREYYLAAKPIVREQLAKGGVRLAQALNAAFAASVISEDIRFV